MIGKVFQNVEKGKINRRELLQTFGLTAGNSSGSTYRGSSETAC